MGVQLGDEVKAAFIAAISSSVTKVRAGHAPCIYFESCMAEQQQSAACLLL